MICRMLTEFLDTYSEGLGLCLSNPRLPSEHAEEMAM